jgi:hypothetical protein
MNNNSDNIAICPLFNFQILEVLTGEHSKEETREYCKALAAKFVQGFQISDEIQLRLITARELERFRNSAFFEFAGEVSRRITPKTFVLEINPHKPERMNTIVDESLLSMRLHKAGDVFYKIILSQQNPQSGSMVSTGQSILWTPHNYVIEISEIEEIRKIIDKIGRIDLDKNRTFRIACERFSRSYEERRDDDKIIDFAIAFESLFFEGNKAPSNTGQFVGLGCSMLIGKDNEDRKEISQFFRKAYELRNKIVHGAEIVTPIKINGREYEMHDLTAQLQEYLRTVIKKLM